MAFETETIGAFTFCKAKGQAPIPPTKRRPWLWALYAAAYVGYIFLAHYAVVQVRLGLSAWGWVIAGPVLLVLFGALFFFFVCQPVRDYRRSHSKQIPSPPESAHSTAIPMAFLCSGHMSDGWLWIDGGWMIFEGDTFCFRLKRSDVFWPAHEHVETLEIVLPKGYPPLPVNIIFGGRPGAHLSKKVQKKFREMVHEWENQKSSEESSIFPPITPSQSTGGGKEVAKIFLAAAGVIALVFATPLLIAVDFHMSVWWIALLLFGCTATVLSLLLAALGFLIAGALRRSKERIEAFVSKHRRADS